MSALGALLLLGAALFVALRWQALPAEIPSHFNFSGEPTGWGDKGALLGLLVTGWVLYIVLVVVSFFPQTWNLPGRPAFRVTSFGAAGRSPRALQASADLLALMRVELAGLFAWVEVCASRGASLGKWFLPCFLAVLGVTLLIGIIRTAR